MGAVPVVVVRRDLSRTAREHVLFVMFPAVQVRSAFEPGVDDGDADTLPRRPFRAHGVEPERLEQRARFNRA